MATQFIVGTTPLARLESILRAAHKEGVEVLAVQQYPNLADAHLYSVLVYRHDEISPYVLWSYNDQGGLFWGHYHATRECAYADWLRTVTERVSCFLSTPVHCAPKGERRTI